MRIVHVVGLLAGSVLLPAPAIADSASDVKGLPAAQFKRILMEHTVCFDPGQQKAALDWTEALDSQPPEIVRLRKVLREDGSTVPFHVIMAALEVDGHQGFCRTFADHDDVLLRFVANVRLAMSGDSNAAKSVHEMLHDETLSRQQQQLLKTWCMGMGIRASSDTAATILEHLTVMSGKERKLKPGDVAPNFQTVDVLGRKIALKQYRGKVVVLHFWATWCGAARCTLPSVKTELQKYPADAVSVIGVSLDDDRNAFDKAIKDHELPWTNVFDGKGWMGRVARMYGVCSVPFDVVIDADGKVQSNSIADVERLLSGKSLRDE
jgi:peroxiredoxin